LGVPPVCQPEAGQRDAREADAEFLQRRATRDGLGQAFREFIEVIVHTLAFLVFVTFLGAMHATQLAAGVAFEAHNGTWWYPRF
jgi:hypothetical protein